MSPVIGTVKLTEVPFTRVLSTATQLPRASISCLTIARPRPAPPENGCGIYQPNKIDRKYWGVVRVQYQYQYHGHTLPPSHFHIGLQRKHSRQAAYRSVRYPINSVRPVQDVQDRHRRVVSREEYVHSGWSIQSHHSRGYILKHMLR